MEKGEKYRRKRRWYGEEKKGTDDNKSKNGLKEEWKDRWKWQRRGDVDAMNHQQPNILLAVFRRPRNNSAKSVSIVFSASIY
jgi:hypothetical protein